MTLDKAKNELNEFVKLKTTMRPVFADVLASDDVVEVVRCKNCAHRDHDTQLCSGRGWPIKLVPDDGFCDKGETKC